MFQCVLGHQTKPGEKLTRVVIEKRQRTYENGGVGWEILREVPVCPEHAEAIRKEEEGK